MAYTPNTWEDRIATGDNRFTDQDSNVYEFTPAPTYVQQNGTPFSAAWMNHIEDRLAFMGKQLWTGSWQYNGTGKPSSIPTIGDYTVLYLQTSVCGVIVSADTSYSSGFRFSGKNVQPVFLSTSSAEVAVTIRCDSSGASWNQNFQQITLVNNGSTTINASPGFTIDAIYGLF